MLDAFVIEEIKRRERDRGREDQPSVQIPLPPPPQAEDGGPADGSEVPDRGVIIIDYG